MFLLSYSKVEVNSGSVNVQPQGLKKEKSVIIASMQIELTLARLVRLSFCLSRYLDQSLGSAKV